MKKAAALLGLLAFTFLVAVPKTTAQSLVKAPQDPDTVNPVNPINMSPADTTTVNIDGIVGEDGKTLQADSGKTWNISNPKALKRHVGQHVAIRGAESSDSHSLTVESVTEFADKARSTATY